MKNALRGAALPSSSRCRSKILTAVCKERRVPPMRSQENNCGPAVNWSLAVFLAAPRPVGLLKNLFAQTYGLRSHFH